MSNRKPKYFGDRVADEQLRAIRAGTFDCQQNDYWILNGFTFRIWWYSKWDKYYFWGRKYREPVTLTLTLPPTTFVQPYGVVSLLDDCEGCKSSYMYEYTHDGVYKDKRWRNLADLPLELWGY